MDLIKTFDGGIGRDYHEMMVPSDVIDYSLNMVEYTQRNKFAGLSFEPGNETHIDLGKTVKILSYDYDPGRDWIILFSKRIPQETDVKVRRSNEIGYIANGKYTKIINDDDYNCDFQFNDCEKINFEIKYWNECQEMHIYWTSSGVGRYINVDLLLNDKRARDLKCDDFLMMKGAPSPRILINKSETGGARTEAGTYQFFVQLEDDSGNKTNYSIGSDIVKIGSENNIPGELSNEAIDLYIYPLTNRYDKINIICRKTINGISSTFIVYSGNYSSNGMSYKFYGKTNSEIFINDIELLERKETTFKFFQMFQDDGILYFSKIVKTKELNYFQRAAKIKAYPVAYILPLADANKYTQLPRDENILPFIVWNFDDGTSTKAYPLIDDDSYFKMDPCADYPWIKGNNGTFPQGLIPRPTSSSANNVGGSACNSCNIINGGTGINIGSGGGCSGGKCGDYNKDPQPLIDLMRSMDNETFLQMVPPPGSENYEFDIYNLIYKEKIGGTKVIATLPPELEGAFGVNLIYTDESSQTDDTHDNEGKEPDCTDPDCYNPCEPCETCSPCTSNDIAAAAFIPKGYREAARACCPGCTDAEVAAVNSFAALLAFCKKNKSTKYAGKESNYDIKKDFDQLAGPAEPIGPIDNSENEFKNAMAMTFQNETMVCYEMVINYDEYDPCELNVNPYAEPLTIPKTETYYIAWCPGDEKGRNKGWYNRVNGEKLNVEADKYLNWDNINWQEVFPGLNLQGRACSNDPNPEDPQTWITITWKGWQLIEVYDCDFKCPITVDPVDEEFEDKNLDKDYPMTPIYAPDGCTIIGYKPWKLGKGTFGKFYTNYTYPTTKDCQGNYLYGQHAGKNIRLFKVPDADTIPTSAGGYGVVNRYNMDNTVGSETYAIMIGLALENIEWPTLEELPKPLNKEIPWSIFFANIDEFNQSKIAEGIVINTFEGQVYGQDRSYMRHGVNSAEKVDRFISGIEIPVDIPGGGSYTRRSRLGYQRSQEKPIYGFFSPDTMYNKPTLFSGYLALYDTLKGAGFRYGIAEEGIEIDDRRVGRINQKGVRSSMFLSLSNEIKDKEGYKKQINIKGIGYVGANETANIQGIDLPIVNKSRESLVAFQLENKIPYEEGTWEVTLDEADKSFIGYITNHEMVLSGVAKRAAIKRVNMQQFGPIPDMFLVRWGSMCDGSRIGQKEVDGLVGNTNVGLFAFTRKSYVSDMLGETVANPGNAVDYPDATQFKKYLEDKWEITDLFSESRLNDINTVPKSADVNDIRNLIQLRDDPKVTYKLEKDTFFPALHHMVIYYVAESRVDLTKLKTGIVEEWQINPINLKTKHKSLDSSLKVEDRASALSPDGGWDNSLLNSFYWKMKMMNRSQRVGRSLFYLAKATVPTLLLFAIVLYGLAGGMFGFILAAFTGIAVYYFVSWLIKNLLTDEFINDTLNIETVKPDRYRGNKDKYVVGFRDNYKEYNYDYSTPDMIHNTQPFPDNFRICDCLEYTNKIIATNKQVIDSLNDAWINNNGNRYFMLTKDRGQLQRVLNIGGNMVAQTTDGLYVFRNNQGQIVFQPIVSTSGEGIYGTTMPNAGIMTKYGYITLDDETGCLWLISPDLQGKKLGSKSEQFLEQILKLCNRNGCVDQKNGWGFNMGYDPNFERLLVTKVEGEKGWTLSISLNPQSKAFGEIISFHSYIPTKGYLWNRSKLYALYENKIFLHNTQKRKYTVFDDKYYGAKIRFIVNGFRPAEEYNFESFVLKSFMIHVSNEEWDTKNNEYIKYLDTIYDKFVLYNEDQTTGLMKLIPRDQNNNDMLDKTKIDETYIFKVQKHWNVNKIKNAVVNPIKESLFKNDLCNVTLQEINYDYDNKNKGYEADNKFNGRYIGYMFVFDQEDKKHKNVILHYLISKTER